MTKESKMRPIKPNESSSVLLTIPNVIINMVLEEVKRDPNITIESWIREAIVRRLIICGHDIMIDIGPKTKRGRQLGGVSKKWLHENRVKRAYIKGGRPKAAKPLPVQAEAQIVRRVVKPSAPPADSNKPIDKP